MEQPIQPARKQKDCDNTADQCKPLLQPRTSDAGRKHSTNK